MNKTKHTPGPWRVSNHARTADGREVECAPDSGIFDACIMTTNKEGRLVAIAGERGSKLNPYDYLPVSESSANMHLIAAAPDLLAACEKLVDYRRRVGPLNFQLEKADDYIRMIEMAIAAATSEVS